MKTSRSILAVLWLISILATPTVQANDGTKRTATSTNWVPSDCNTFTVRTRHIQDDLCVWVNSTVRQSVMVSLTDDKGNEVAWTSLGRKPSIYGARFDISDLPDGTYRLNVKNDTQSITKQVVINTPQRPGRQAEIAVLK